MYKKNQQHSELYRELLENKPDNIKILKYLKPKQLAFIADNGMTPLMVAFSNYYDSNGCDTDIILEIVKLSTNHGLQNDNGETALILACQKYSRSPNYDRKVFLELLSTDCNPGAADYRGGTALMFAVGYTLESELIFKLLKLECKLGAVNQYGETALMYAIVSGDSEVILKLLELDCNPAAVDNNGKTALTRAIWELYSGLDPEVCYKLLELECNPGLVDKYGDTPLMLAINHQINPEIILKLIELECNPDAVDKDGENAFNIATTIYFYNNRHDDKCDDINILYIKILENLENIIDSPKYDGVITTPLEEMILSIKFSKHPCGINRYNLIKKLYLKSSADEQKRYLKDYIKLRNTHEIRH